GLAGEIEEPRRHAEESGGGRRWRRAGSLAPVDVSWTHAIAQQRARRGLPALERGLDLDGHHGSTTRAARPTVGETRERPRRRAGGADRASSPAGTSVER